MSDDAARFGSAVNPMLKQLFGVWRPTGEAQASAPVSADTHAATARPFVYATGWFRFVFAAGGLERTPSSGGGTILAQGPNGESDFLGFPFLAMNSSNRRVQRTQQWAQQGGGRNTSSAQTLYYPYGADLAKTYVDLTQMWRSRNGLPPALGFARQTRSGLQQPSARPDRDSGQRTQRACHGLEPDGRQAGAR